MLCAAAALAVTVNAVSGTNKEGDALVADGPYGMWSLDAEQVTLTCAGQLSYSDGAAKPTCMDSNTQGYIQYMALRMLCKLMALIAVVLFVFADTAVGVSLDVQRFFWMPVENNKPRVTIVGRADFPKEVTVRGKWVRGGARQLWAHHGDHTATPSSRRFYTCIST